MALTPFDGTLDAEPTSLQPFSGSLDGEKPKKEDGDYVRGLKKYVPQMQQMYGAGKAVLGKAIDSNPLIESGIASMREADSKIQSIGNKPTDEITGVRSIGDFADWAQHGLGQVTGNLAETALAAGAGTLLGAAGANPLTAGIGGVTGVIGKGVVKKALKDQAESIAEKYGAKAASEYVAKGLTEDVAKKTIGRTIGQNAAIAGMAGFHGVGETGSRAFEEAGYDPSQVDLGKVVPAALAHTAGEFVGDKIALGGMFGKGGYRASGKGIVPAAKTIGGNMAIVAGKEIPVEMFQTEAERYAAGLPLANEEAGKELLNTAAQTALFGIAGVPAGVRAYNGSRYVDGKLNQPQDQQETAPVVPDGVSLTADPSATKQRIDAMLGLDTARMDDKGRALYEQDLAAAFNEPIGIRLDENQNEVPYTMGEYLDNQVNGDFNRALPLRENAADSANNRLAQLADEEAQQHAAITQDLVRSAAQGGALSKAALTGIQTGATQMPVHPERAAIQQQMLADEAAQAELAPIERLMRTRTDEQVQRVANNESSNQKMRQAAAAEIRRRETAQGETNASEPLSQSIVQPSQQQKEPTESLAVVATQSAPKQEIINAAQPAQMAAQASQANDVQANVTPEPVAAQSIPQNVQVSAEQLAKRDTATVNAEKPAETPGSALQNRDRGRAASVNQMQSIARNPDYMRLGPSRTPDSGAPMVFSVGNDHSAIPADSFGASDVAVMSDGQRVPFRYAVVNANLVQPSSFADGMMNPAFSSIKAGTLKALNNGRSAGVIAAHAAGNAGAYVGEMLGDVAHGVSADVIRSTPNPMLIRVYSEEANTDNMAAKSQGQGLGMSASERAAQDAELMTGDVLDKFAPLDIAAAGNRDFVRAFVGKLPENELADMMDATGNLSQDGRRRIEAALLTAAYGKSDLVQELFESTDTDIKAIGNALKVVSGQWAIMRQAAKDGVIDPATDMTANLIEAVNIVRRSRAEGSSVAELAGQGDLMGGNYLNELSELFLRIFYKGAMYDRARGGEKVIAGLQDIVTSAMNTKADAGLFGDSFKPTPKQIVQSARSKIDEKDQPASQSALFGANGQATAISQGNRGESAAQSGEVGQRPVGTNGGEEVGKQAEPVAQQATAPVERKVTTEDARGQQDVSAQPKQDNPVQSNAKSDASLARTKDRNEVRFETPYVGIGGNYSLVGYVWPNKKEEYIDRRGEDRVRTVSDWEAAVENLETGRQIVHQFAVKKSDGTEQDVSAETAAKLLGVSESTVRNNAKKQLEKAIAKEKSRILEIKEADDLDAIDAQDSPAMAVSKRAMTYSNNSPMIERMAKSGESWATIDNRIERESAGREKYRFLTKDGKFVWSHSFVKEGDEEYKRGWRNAEFSAREIWPAQPVKATTEAKAVEPWQMTRDEFFDQGDAPVRNALISSGLGKIELQGYRTTYEYESPAPSGPFKGVTVTRSQQPVGSIIGMPFGRAVVKTSTKLKGGQAILDRGELFELGKEYHKRVVADAIAAGKPVPANVLADYPDLKPKSVEPAAQSAEQKIRSAFDALPSVSLGVAYPITVEHNGVKREFMVRQDAIGRGKIPALHVVAIHQGRMIASDEKSWIAQSYKLNWKNDLTEEGLPKKISDQEADEFKANFKGKPAAVDAKKEAELKKGTVLYHGTQGQFSLKDSVGTLFLTTSKNDAIQFGIGIVPGHERTDDPRLVEIVVTEDSKVKDINSSVEDALMNDDDVDSVIVEESKSAKSEGYDFVHFNHPSIDGGDMDVWVSTNSKNIAIKNSFAKKEAETKETDKGVALYSKGNNQGGITRAQVESRIKSILSDKLGKVMIDSGRVTLVDTEQGLKNLPGARYMVAWHGSPHDHDKFDSSKIGTGEGAQAYGYGHYFASSKDVAEWYRDKLGNVLYNGKPVEYEQWIIGKTSHTPLDIAVQEVSRILNKSKPSSAFGQYIQGKSFDDAVAEARIGFNQQLAGLKTMKQDGVVRKMTASLNKATEELGKLRKQDFSVGKLYQVELAPSEDEYLDWDKPLSEQSEIVRKALTDKSHFIGEYLSDALEIANDNGVDFNEYGKSLYKIVSDQYGSDKVASDYLHSIGIRGIRYLDGSSRSAGKGNHNYVIFSDDDVSITAKYAKQNGGIQGATFPDGRIVLVLENLNADNFDGVFKHEGVHSVLRETLGEEAYKALEQRFVTLMDMSIGRKERIRLTTGQGEKTKADGSSPGSVKEWFNKAIAAIPNNTNPADFVQEIMGYATEQYTNGAKQPNIIKRWVESFLSALRTAIIRHLPNGKLKLWAVKNIQPQDLANLAIAGLKAKAKGQLQAQGREEMAFSRNESVQSSYGLPSEQSGNRTIDGAELRDLRRAAARLERPEAGITFRITEDGTAIATGPKGVRVPERYTRFAEDHGLAFESRRLPVAGGTKSPAMPAAYRQDGALYFGEMASNARPIDRTGKTRFSKINQTDTPKTINVDGIERPTINSSGKPIAQTDEGLRNFWRWFGDSKAADADGNPLVVYHGTDQDFNEFSFKWFGRTDAGARGKGFYFSENPEYASRVADSVSQSGWGNANVMPVYLKAEHPFEWDGQNNNLGMSASSFSEWLRKNKYDSVHNKATGEWVVLAPTQIKSAIGNNGDFDATNPDIRYSRAQIIGDISEQAKETVMRLAGRPMLDPSDPFAAENARLREHDQSLWSKAKKQLRRYLAPGGLLPQSVFAEKIKRDSEFQAVEFDVRHLIGGLERAAKSDFGVSFDKLNAEQMRQITDALAGKVPASLPEATKTAAVAMRQYIDSMSTEYLKIIQEKIDAKMLKALETGKDSDKAQAINEIELYEKIKGNIGRYVHRSYQAFDDPKWFEKVPTSVLNSARQYLKQGYVETGETESKAAQMAEVALHEILKNGTAYDSMEAFIAESKLGAKDLSVLMRRKEVPAQIRALLGEYPDARLNFTKSATKMGRLIWNTRFLDRVRDIGMGSFFFEGKDRPPNATTQIAAAGSEVYSPLNGLWTFPEISQAFKDALGKEQMSDMYRAIVRANGLVKYGKTVLAPTTAMRNWQSAMFFSLANGHFDLTQMKESIAAFREQVSQKATGADLKYLRHLKQLGVVYDTPFAGEMARLMEDARMEELLSTDKGDAVRWFRKANQLAQGFYAFGDDFWKIIGFENEKAGLMKAGLSLQEAEAEAAKRIRDTYPTYSMVGSGVRWLSRFPLAGTFVSFPAEIIRTSANMLRTVASDLKSDNPKLRELGMKRAAGMAFVSAAFWALAALSKSLAGVDDDEEEAIRDLAPEWQKNSTFLFAGRDEDGNLRYFDLSFLDPYGYWKRPITAMMRNQPWEESLASGLRGMLEPFLGADIAAKAIFESVANKKDSGGKVFKENDGAIDQAIDIADHLRKALQPGVVSNVERLINASQGVRKSSGQPYSMEDELVALVGWRATTIEPKTALHYRSYEFTDALAEARKTITDTLRDANEVSPDDIKDAKARANAKQEQAFKEMIRLVGAAEAAGMSKMQIMQTLRLSNISQANISYLMRGVTPPVSVTPQLATKAIQQARVMRGNEFATEVSDRYRTAMAN